MKIQIWSIGKEHEPYIKTGVEDFTKRISRYYPVEWKLFPAPKNAGSLSPADLKKKEAEGLLEILTKEDWLVALDERGKSLNSEALAQFIQDRANDSTKQLIFLIGGAYGLDGSILKRVN